MLKTHTIGRGAAYFIKIPLLIQGAPRPVVGWKFKFTVKLDPSDADAAAIIQKSTDAGTILPLPEDSTCAYVVGDPADTKLRPVGRYFFDIWAESPTGDPYQLERGYFETNHDITKGS